MARDRVITAQQRSEDQEPSDSGATSDPGTASPALRPVRMGEYVGQGELVERLSIALEAVRQRKESMEHVLLHGPPGLGKTTLAHVIATEMGTRLYTTSGPALSKAGDLIGTLTRMSEGDVLFIDEIHRMPAAVEEYIYPAMEDFKVDFTVDSGMHAKVITVGLKPFTLIGATTRAGLLTQPLRSRFGIAHHLDYYDNTELRRILVRAVDRLSMADVSEAALDSIASRSRGTPRVALRLLRRVRDFAQVRSHGALTPSVVEEALALEGVDGEGLDELDRKYLSTIFETYGGGPVGLEAIAATMGDDATTLEDVVEPYLLQKGFLARTRQGRCLTQRAGEHLDFQVPGDLF